MFRFRSRPARHPDARRRSSRLGCEPLERRDCPAAPIINSLNVARLEGPEVRISGLVTDEQPGQCDIQISGAATGRLRVAADGSYAGKLKTNGFGQITARAFDPEGLISRPMEFDYQKLAPAADSKSEAITFGNTLNLAKPLFGDDDNAAPIIMSYSAQNQSGMWALSGFVLDEYAPGLRVTFHSGISTINNRTAIVGSNGWFSIAFSLPAGSNGGYVSATTVDWYGAPSNEPFVYVG